MQAQRAVVRWLRLVLPRGSVVASIRNEAQPRSQDPNARARFFQVHKSNGVLAGMPDLIVRVPGHPTLWIEMKRPDGAGLVSVDQQSRHAELRACGDHVHVATCIESARRALHIAQIPTNEAFGQPHVEPRYRLEKPKSAISADAIPF